MCYVAGCVGSVNAEGLIQAGSKQIRTSSESVINQ